MFKPLVFETYGNWSKDVQDLLGHLSQKISHRSAIPHSVILNHMEVELSAKLHSFNAYICLLRNERIMYPGLRNALEVDNAMLLNEVVVAE